MNGHDRPRRDICQIALGLVVVVLLGVLVGWMLTTWIAPGGVP